MGCGWPACERRRRRRGSKVEQCGVEQHAVRTEHSEKRDRTPVGASASAGGARGASACCWCRGGGGTNLQKSALSVVEESVARKSHRKRRLESLPRAKQDTQGSCNGVRHQTRHRHRQGSYHASSGGPNCTAAPGGCAPALPRTITHRQRRIVDCRRGA